MPKQSDPEALLSGARRLISKRVAAVRLVACVGVLVAAAGLVGCGDGGGGGAAPTVTPTIVPTAAPTPPAAVAGAGLTGEIVDVQVAGDGQVTVMFTLTDAAGVPIQPVSSAATSDQAARVRFALAHLETYDGGGEFRTEFSRYVNDIDAVRPRYDSNGTLSTVDARTGVYRYTFGKILGEDADLSRTYSVGMQADRTYAGVQLSANPVFDVVPSGGIAEIRESAPTTQCNQCHDPLRLHGNRREVRLCSLCHTQAATDEKGRSVDLSVMVHKIHAGKDLPSVADGAPGASYAIFSSFARADVVFAQKNADGVVSGVGFPRPLNDCATCHTDGATSHYFTDRPAAAPCTSCHDDVNPSLVATAAGPPGTKHIQNRGFADGDCQFCHLAEATGEFDISVPGAHVVPERSQQLAGLVVDITALANHGAGQTPLVSFRVTDSAGEALRDLSGLNRLGFTLAGPTSDYATVQTATAVGGGAGGTLTGPAADGTFVYSPAVGLPADATGTWAVGAEARRSVMLAAPGGDPRTVNEAAVNPVLSFAIEGDEPQLRRVVVEDAKCQNCHGEFSRGVSIHGNLRNQAEYCVLCHNPNASDAGRRSRDPAAVARGDTTASIDFKDMIHRIHTGEELENKPYIIYGFGPAPANFTAVDFAEVLFPGDRRRCETCHAEDTYLLPPFPGAALGTRIGHLDPTTGREVEDGRLGPIQSACTSCHDSAAAVAHAETQTSGGGDEACTVCHAEGRAVAVSSAHARDVE